jgi:hypothetical protein
MAHPIPLVPALLGAFFGAQAEPEERHAVTIHSDLPLWTHRQGNLWPRGFVDDDSFGCESRVRYGVWRLDEAGEEEEEATWYRFANYGVFHCFMLVKHAHVREGLAGGDSDASFLVELGTTRGRDGPVELWALQRGVVPGSDYLLLSRPPVNEAITAFDVLQRECPRGRLRSGPQISILLTRYCVINDRQELTQLARRMARLPALGRLTFVAADEEQDDD